MQADAHTTEAARVEWLELQGRVCRVGLQQFVVTLGKPLDFGRQGFEALPETARGEMPQSSRALPDS